MSYQWSPEFWQTWLEQAPVLCVDVVVKQDDKVALVKRATVPFQGYWHLPGSVVRKNETLKMVISRVMANEVGLTDYKLEKMIGIFDDPQRDPRGHFITVAFLVQVTGFISATNPQGEEVRLFKNLPAELGFDAEKIFEASKK
ncbi:MAG: NUDIX hydrolase [Candidatus Pacebacteria bacterium]|nr:NUDIX hydrolase [Candidatus Paceibacterota bacterium]